MTNEHNQSRSPASAAVSESITSIDDGWLLDDDTPSAFADSGAASLAEPPAHAMAAVAEEEIVVTDEGSPSTEVSAVVPLQRVGGPPPLPVAQGSLWREEPARPPPLPVPAAAASVHHQSGGPPPLPVSADQEFAALEESYVPPPVPRRPSTLPGPQPPKWEREALERAEAIRLANKV